MKNLEKRFNELICLGLFLMLTFCLGGQAMGQNLGMVADDATDTVTVFNADTDMVLATFPVPPGAAIGDCSITPDQKFGFVTNFNGVITVIDLQALAPLPAIPISNTGEDTSITADGKCMVVCDGGEIQPVSSIDINTMTEVDTLPLGQDCNSVDVCSDGTVLATSAFTGLVYRLTVDSSCMLTNTGDTIVSGVFPNNITNNVTCAPDSASLVTLQRTFPGVINSFTTPPLAGPVNSVGLSGAAFGLSACINQSVNTVYARSVGIPGGPGFIDAFAYDSLGNIGAPIFPPIPIANTPTFFGMEQMALHPNNAKLYVSQPNALDVFDANTGAPLTSIIDANIVQPTGVCFAQDLAVPVDIKPTSCPNPLNTNSKGVLPVAILGTAVFDVTQVDVSTVLLAGVSPILSSLQDVATPFQPFLNKASCTDCNELGPDGITDLTLKFDAQEVIAALGGVSDGDCVVLDLTGNLLNGASIIGEDVVKIIMK